MRYLLFLLLLGLTIDSISQTVFEELYTGECLRLDYVLTGNVKETDAFFSKLSKELKWSGSYSGFKDPFINGNYFGEIYDPYRDSVIFQKSFNTLFGEWQTTEEAKYRKKAFQQSFYFPCPKDPVVFRLYKRKDRHSARLLMEMDIDPDNFLIERETMVPEFIPVRENGDPAVKTDLLFIAEGYTLAGKEKFLSDVKRFTEYFFSIEPFSRHQEEFNIYALPSFSARQGTDNPGISRWVQTPAETSFYTFGSERYLTSSEYWKICDLIKNVPHDHILIMVNTDKYGGGGIYNHYSIFTSDHPLSEIVFVHEFGHGFAGLGDEYYDSEVAYESFYPLDEEPLPPNLTTLVDFDAKWKDMVDEDVPVPTPAVEKYEDRIGVFEGGGYAARGVYRPEIKCRMKSNDAERFCKVCREALTQIIKHYSGK